MWSKLEGKWRAMEMTKNQKKAKKICPKYNFLYKKDTVTRGDIEP